MFEHLILYETQEGRIPFEEWLCSFKDKNITSRIRARMDRLFRGNFGDSQNVGNGVFELRCHFGSGYRVYFGIDQQIMIILLLGGDKSTQESDIRRSSCILDGLSKEAEMKAGVDYYEYLIKHLRKNPDEAAAYLNAALEAGDKGAFLLALRNVMEVLGGMTKMSDRTKINRVSLYKMLSPNGNPGFENIMRILQTAGIRFQVILNLSNGCIIPTHRTLFTLR